MPSNNDKVVLITMQNGLPVPDQDPVEVKKDNQKIRWCADFDFQITVDGYSDLSYSSNGPECPFACKTGTFPEIRSYKYTITANGVANDPSIDVKP